MKLAWLALALASVGGSATAQDLVDAGDAEKVLDIARGYGDASLETQADGHPRIAGTLEGIPYYVFFMNCTNGATCEDINFYAGFRDLKPTLDAINAWNRDKRFGNAYLDADLDAAIEYDVNLEGGVSPDNLNAAFGVWSVVVAEYSSYVGYRPK